MGITVAKSAGFCFGVDRAVQVVYSLLEQGEKVYTLGPIIHNPQMIAELGERGVTILDTIENAPKDGVIVIRAHGIPREITDTLERGNYRFVNATCPFVSKIHSIVEHAAEQGRAVFIFGDPNHPEVIGIRGHCDGECFIFQDHKAFDIFTNNFPDWKNKPVTVVVQTTFQVAEFKNCLKILKRVYTNATIFDTICNATVSRQSEAVELAKNSDLMVIIGGRHSSNTVKLFNVCKDLCDTVLIESADELPLEKVRAANNVGITAGASTPAAIIKEVLHIMSVEKNEEMNENFAEMLEESLKSFDTNDKVHGVVVGVYPNEVTVDVGRKQAGFIPANELSSDPNAKPEDLVKVGDELDLLIMRTNDQEGTIMLSKKRLDAQKGWEAIAQAEEDGTVVTGVVTEIIKGGVIAVTNGVRVFIPASQATASRGDSLDALLKKEVQFRIIEVNRSRRRAVGSIRSVLKDLRKAEAEKFWETAEEGKEYEGVVKSITNYGAFVDLGGIDGMVHISELSWSRIKHPTEVVNVGDTVKVYIKKLDRENNKISLGYKKAEDNPWEILKEKYPVGTVTDVTIVGMTSFGAFARIIPGIDGLIHISQIANKRIEKPQDVLKMDEVVKAKITEIDFDKKRVSLSIRAILPQEEAAPAEEAAAENTAENAAE